MTLLVRTWSWRSLEVSSLGELLAVAARRRHSRRRCRNAWTAAAAVATAHSGIDRRRRWERQSYTILYTYVQCAPRASTLGCAHLRPPSFFDIACIYIHFLSLYIVHIRKYNVALTLRAIATPTHTHTTG